MGCGRSAGALAATLALLLLGALVVNPPAHARAADSEVVSLEQFRAGLPRLQQLVSACEESVKACEPSRVGPDEEVHLSPAADGLNRSGSGSDSSGPDAGFTVHWQWLRDSLTPPHPDPDAEPARQAELRTAAARLDEIARESAVPGASANQQQSFARAQATLRDVLAQPEFRDIEEVTWWDRLKSRLLQMLAALFGGVGRLGKAVPWLGKLLEWLLFAGAAAGLLAFFLRNLSRQRVRVAMGAPIVQKRGWDLEATDWAERAERHAASSEWRDGVHCLYWAAIVLLESQRAWRHNPTRTPREYILLLPTGSTRQVALRRLTRILERVWYGLHDATPEEYAQARELYEGLAAGAEIAGLPDEPGPSGTGSRPATAADAAGIA
jgi:hypothetical protein